MPLSQIDQDVLQEIVDEAGNCLKSTRCKVCPFRSMCLPEFLFPKPLSREERMTMALDVLVHHSLLDENIEVQDLNKKHYEESKNKKRHSR
jgi:hypothetical protein